MATSEKFTVVVHGETSEADDLVAVLEVAAESPQVAAELARDSAWETWTRAAEDDESLDYPSHATAVAVFRGVHGHCWDVVNG
jgi:hypothetical protein